jgi:DNA repair protein RAD50
MTTVDKLLVQGIRSFGPHKRNVIDFYTPLTLIVGQNGAGKTVCNINNLFKPNRIIRP